MPDQFRRPSCRPSQGTPIGPPNRNRSAIRSPIGAVADGFGWICKMVSERFRRSFITVSDDFGGAWTDGFGRSFGRGPKPPLKLPFRVFGRFRVHCSPKNAGHLIDHTESPLHAIHSAAINSRRYLLIK